MGDIRPTASEIREKMNSLEDDYDKQEPDPEPFLRAKNANPPRAKEVPKCLSILLDTSLETFVPALPDQYEGPNRLDSQESSYP
jgi:hypothetical protein